VGVQTADCGQWMRLTGIGRYWSSQALKVKKYNKPELIHYLNKNPEQINQHMI